MRIIYAFRYFDMKKYLLNTFVCVCLSYTGFSQLLDSGNLKLNGYLETYYIYDFNEPVTNDRPDFFYSFDRHNEININLGAIMLSYESERIKSKIALMSGTYARANLAHEPSIYRSILEATISYKLSEKSNTWVTAGVFPSHIGFESAIGADCFNMTRSLMAESSPYYLAGAKINHTTKNEKWEVGLTVANGWQRIHRSEPLESIGVGHNLSYMPTDKLSLNSNSYVGEVARDSSAVMRYFHDFYSEIKLSNSMDIILGFDIGAQQSSINRDEYFFWYTPAVIARYKISEKLRLGGRLEYYDDPDEVIITSIEQNGFSVFGGSLNLDVQLSDRLLFRTEARGFLSEKFIFRQDNLLVNYNFFIGSSLSFKLE